MTEYLSFQLYGPMQAYGGIAVGEVRRTVLRPGRSAIAGLLGACLGISREDDAIYLRLAESLGVAVRVDIPGEPMTDYHTAQAPSAKSKRVFRTRRDEVHTMLEADEELNTILSSRSYLQDALFTVCCWLQGANAPFTLEAMEKALMAPLFTPYLGRKSCPAALPFKPMRGVYPSAVAALEAREIDRQFLRQLLRLQPNKAMVYCEADAQGCPGDADTVMVRDLPLSRTGSFRFANRQERMWRAPTRPDKEE